MEVQHNPFSSPRASGSATARRRGSPVWAVSAGVLTDIGGSLLVGTLTSIVAAALLVAGGTPPERVESVLVNPDPTSWLSISGYFVGCAFSFLGGYVCSRIARHAEYHLAGVQAVLVVSFGLLISAVSESNLTPAIHGVLVLLSVGSVMLGAWRGAVLNRRVTA
jgi:hypothetical protein